MDDVQLRDILERSRTVAVLGAHDDPAKPAHYVPDYLSKQGYEVVGINPKLAGTRLFGHDVVGSLSDLGGPVDLLDVFRATRWLPGHLPEILAMDPRPKVVWLQLGIADEAFATALRGQGITVVMDRCTLAEHRRLGVGAAS